MQKIDAAHLCIHFQEAIKEGRKQRIAYKKIENLKYLGKGCDIDHWWFLYVFERIWMKQCNILYYDYKVYMSLLKRYMKTIVKLGMCKSFMDFRRDCGSDM